jgi:hypothetical protein
MHATLQFPACLSANADRQCWAHGPVRTLDEVFLQVCLLLMKLVQDRE